MVEPTKPAPWMSEIDWDKIASQLPEEIRTDINIGELPDRSFWILKAAALVSKSSIRSKAKSLLNAQVRRWEASWLEDIKFYASQKGLSFEDAFIELVKK